MTDPLIDAARFLAEHVEWIRHRPEAAEVLADIDAARRILVGLIDGPAPGRYLGPCGSAACAAYGLGDHDCVEHGACEGDVYAREGSDHGTCRTCGARFNVAERRAWLDDEVRSRAFRASQIGEAFRINVNTIRSWALRGRLVPHGHDERERPLFNVGDVLDLAAEDAARRATNEAKRARRKGREDEAA